MSVASRKTHGAVGTFDLALAQTPANPTIEPRSGGGNHSIVFTFDKAVSDGAVAVPAGIAIAGTPAFNGTEMIVPLADVMDAQYVTVEVGSVASADGGTGGTGAVRVGFLAGDVNGSRTVSLSDLLLVNAVLTQAVGPSNYLRDVNLSGGLSISDLLVVNANPTKVLPSP
jgi:hypothetical protein